MGILIGVLYLIEVVVCLLLSGVVMLQKPKEGGLGGLAGGMGEAVFGADAGNVLIKTTIWLGTIFLVNTLVLARLTSTIHSGSLMANEKAPAPQTAPAVPQMPAPAAPAPVPVPAAPASAPAAPASAPTAAPATPAPASAPVAAPATPAPASAPTAAPATPAPASAPAATPATPAPAPAVPAESK